MQHAEQLAAKQSEAAKIKAAAAKLKVMTSAPPNGTYRFSTPTPKETTMQTAQPAEDPVAKWNQLVQQKVSQGVPRQRALSLVNRENPGLREQMVQAANSGRPNAGIHRR